MFKISSLFAKRSKDRRPRESDSFCVPIEPLPDEDYIPHIHTVKRKDLAIIDGPCGATGAAAGNNPRIASFEEIRKQVPGPLEEIANVLRGLFRRGRRGEAERVAEELTDENRHILPTDLPITVTRRKPPKR